MLRFLGIAGLLGSALACAPALAGGSGTLSLQQRTLTYIGGPYIASNPTSQAGANQCFDEQASCDVYRLTVDLPADYGQTNPYGLVAVSVSWPYRNNDFEVFVSNSHDLNGGTIIAGNSSSKNPEVITFPAIPGRHEYRIDVFPNIMSVPDSIAGTVYLIDAQAPYLQEGPKPTFADHKPPADMAQSAGEPTLDVNPKTGNVFFIAMTSTYKVRLDENQPGVSTWEDVSSDFTSVTTLDPILTGDPATGRIWVSQLAGVTSLMAFTDDDGATWTPSEGSGIPGGVDHQALGAGPYPPIFQLLSQNPLYPNALYYCSQDLLTALCARSDDGGITFATPVPIYTLECAGIHGHPKVAPDGTVYVPNSGCSAGGNAAQAVVVSEDAGLTWDIRLVPKAVPSQGTDPSVAIGKDGTVYFGYHAYDGHARIAVSRDRGLSWDSDTDVSAPVNVQNVVFPAVIAGDGDRAAFAFHGTTTRGAAISEEFEGIWHLYIATTYDGGRNWVTQSVLPGDPVQGKGGICLSGIACGDNRNLLDFMDATVDEKGRILVSYADGCVGKCLERHTGRSAVGSIVRQTSGPRLYAAFDGTAAPEEKLAEGRGVLLGALGPALLAPLVLLLVMRRRKRFVACTVRT